jgi:HEAT repeat protein
VVSRNSQKFLAVACLLAGMGLVRPVRGYVDLSPTIAKVISDARTIAVVEVGDFDRESRVVTVKERIVLKGQAAEVPLVQQVAESETAIVPRAIVQWAAPGSRAVVFASARTAVVCMGPAWYQLKQIGGKWKLGADRPELVMTYYGSVSRLAVGLQKILAGGEAVLTMVPHGDEENVGFELALNRMAYPGLVTVQRVRANMKMPNTVWTVSSNPLYMVGLGPVDEADLPEVVKQLAAGDAEARAGAAEDIRQLTEIVGAARTRSTVGLLETCLGDREPRGRCAAAGTILRITHGHEKALKVLADGLAGSDKATQREAAEAAAVTGKAGGLLVPALAGLLKDKDERVRFAALQAIGTLGPVAVGARAAVVPLLDEPEEMIDAADALGRMGPWAQPVPEAMVKMLSSEQAQVRLAALRGMAQIGGQEALPAAEYIAREIGTMNEIDAYNMVELLALLGPIASGPASRIRTVPMPNPVVMQAANWAINAPAGLPWVGGATETFGPFGYPVYAGFVEALGERLRPCALALAPRLMAGTAGDVPEWGYKILNAAPEESVATIAPHLRDPSKMIRERAAVILGRMGPPAAGAREQVEAALAAAGDERERNLMGWCLGELTKD